MILDEDSVAVCDVKDAAGNDVVLSLSQDSSYSFEEQVICEVRSSKKRERSLSPHFPVHNHDSPFEEVKSVRSRLSKTPSRVQPARQSSRVVIDLCGEDNNNNNNNTSSSSSKTKQSRMDVFVTPLKKARTTRRDDVHISLVDDDGISIELSFEDNAENNNKQIV